MSVSGGAAGEVGVGGLVWIDVGEATGEKVLALVDDGWCHGGGGHGRLDALIGGAVVVLVGECLGCLARGVQVGERRSGVGVSGWW
jgi:hypothetical protein